MREKKIKPDIISQKLIKGIKIGRKKMLEEKSLRNEFVVYYENGRIVKERARDILNRESKSIRNIK